MDFLLLGCAAVAGYVVAVFFHRPLAAKRMTTYPLCHVSFDSSMTTQDRLRFLAEATSAVEEGRLPEPNDLKNDRASNKAGQPGGGFEN